MVISPGTNAQVTYDAAQCAALLTALLSLPYHPYQGASYSYFYPRYPNLAFYVAVRPFITSARRSRSPAHWIYRYHTVVCSMRTTTPEQGDPVHARAASVLGLGSLAVIRDGTIRGHWYASTLRRLSIVGRSATYSVASKVRLLKRGLQNFLRGTD